MSQETETPVVDYALIEVTEPIIFSNSKKEFVSRRAKSAINFLEQQNVPHDICAFTQTNLKDLAMYHAVTWEHSLDVGDGMREWAIILAAAGLLDEEMEIALYTAGLNHDKGKLEIPISILAKKGPLTAEEYAAMKTHGLESYKEIQAAEDKSVKQLRTPAENLVWNIQKFVAMYHHENADGTGYEGLSYQQDMDNAQTDEQIKAVKLKWRVIGIARVTDTYSALRRPRDYKRGLSHNETMHIMRENLFASGLVVPELEQYFDTWAEKMRAIIEKPTEETPLMPAPNRLAA